MRNSVVQVMALAAGASALLQSSAGTEIDSCFWDAGVGIFNTAFSVDWSSNANTNIDDLTSSTYTVGAGNSPLARRFDMTNIGVADEGYITLTVPGAQTDSPVSTSQLVTSYSDIIHGSVRTVAMVSNVSGTTHGFSFYGNDYQEIDFAFITSDITLCHYTNEQVNYSAVSSSYSSAAPSDASTAWHEYRVDWIPGSTMFYIDSVLVKTLTDNVPTIGGFWLWNNWSNGNSWAMGPPLTDSVLKIRSIEAYFNRTTVADSIAANSSACTPIAAATSSSAATTKTTSSIVAATTTAVTCPQSDGTTYTAANGDTFLIECGIDHVSGDMGSASVTSFAQCIETCANSTGCVDVSLSGVACYLKSTLGATDKNSNIWGAKLVSQATVTSSSSTITSTSAGASSTASAASSASVSSSALASSTTTTTFSATASSTTKPSSSASALISTSPSAASTLASSSSSLGSAASSSTFSSSLTSTVMSSSSLSSSSLTSTVVSSSVSSSSIAKTSSLSSATSSASPLSSSSSSLYSSSSSTSKTTAASSSATSSSSIGSSTTSSKSTAYSSSAASSSSIASSAASSTTTDVATTYASAQTVSFTTVTTGYSGSTTTTTTIVNGLTATVLVETPTTASTTKSTKTTSHSTTTTSSTPIYTTITTDYGTATVVYTVTVTPSTTGGTTTIGIIYPTPVTTCRNTGVAYAAYSNSYAGGQATASYPAYTPQAYKKVTPNFSGVTNYIAESNDASGTISVYGNAGVSAQTLVLDHTFYVFARQTGYYSFNIPYTDDIQFVWVGSNALKGWTRSNADIFQYWNQDITTETPQTLAYNLTIGQYLPVRVQWANGGGAGDLQFNVYAPDGSAIMASVAGTNSGSSSVDIVRFPCDSSLGASFPSWGSET